MPDVVVQREAEAVLGHAACQWLGVPPSPGEPRNLHWARALVDAVRAGLAQPGFDSPLNVIVQHRDADGNLASREDAAAELLGLLRSTVAVARCITFGVLALHEHPHGRARIAAGDDDYLHLFTQEVRRYYPLVPAVGGCALHGFDWGDLHIAQGTWVLLDLYGTNHHPCLWGDPEAFRPERFAGRESNGFDCIPQGGGDAYAGHRCAGDAVAIELAASALRLFATAITYAVPPQDLSINPRRVPALPGSGIVIGQVNTINPP
jgi:fatty-acid peroxygenase